MWRRAFSQEGTCYEPCNKFTDCFDLITAIEEIIHNCKLKGEYGDIYFEIDYGTKYSPKIETNEEREEILVTTSKYFYENARFHKADIGYSISNKTSMLFHHGIYRFLIVNLR